MQRFLWSVGITFFFFSSAQHRSLYTQYTEGVAVVRNAVAPSAQNEYQLLQRLVGRCDIVTYRSLLYAIIVAVQRFGVSSAAAQKKVVDLVVQQVKAAARYTTVTPQTFIKSKRFMWVAGCVLLVVWGVLSGKMLAWGTQLLNILRQLWAFLFCSTTSSESGKKKGIMASLLLGSRAAYKKLSGDALCGQSDIFPHRSDDDAPSGAALFGKGVVTQIQNVGAWLWRQRTSIGALCDTAYKGAVLYKLFRPSKQEQTEFSMILPPTLRTTPLAQPLWYYDTEEEKVKEPSSQLTWWHVGIAALGTVAMVKAVEWWWERHTKKKEEPGTASLSSEKHLSIPSAVVALPEKSSEKEQSIDIACSQEEKATIARLCDELACTYQKQPNEAAIQEKKAQLFVAAIQSAGSTTNEYDKKRLCRFAESCLSKSSMPVK